MNDNRTIDFLGARINNYSLEELEEHIFKLVETKTPSHVVGVNVDQVLKINKDRYSKEIFDNATIVFTDGKPIMWMAGWLGTPIIERTTGPDLMLELCKGAALKGYRVFLLGAGPGVAKMAADKLRNQVPSLIVTGTYSPPFGFEKDDMELNKINEMLRASCSDMLFVGMGSPKQDIFIYENKDKYNIPVSFSMGAAIDFIAGNVKRAPRWMIAIGLEWFYRVFQDPRRLLKRYFIDAWAIVPLFLHACRHKD